MAIYGWSYGGYMTSNTLGKDGGNTFKCGVAVAPLADWRYYDTIYAERYMGDPNIAGNLEGYVKGSIVDGHESSQFENVDYTLIHGTDDDNVHFKNAVEMEKKLGEIFLTFFKNFMEFLLVGDGVELRAQWYADENHSIRSSTAVDKHVHRKILKNLLRCFKLDWRN